MQTPERIGKYEVIEAIGHGGFATVYKARDPLMKRVIAIKLCTEQDEDARRRFLREAQIAGSLDHPSIVRGYDCGFDEKGVYLVEEYLDGEDLRQKIQSRSPISYRVRVEILIEVAQAIGYAHSRGVYHRDIKPGNVRVLASGRVKILDFGIAKMFSQTPLTKAGTLLGTAGYVAPEQVLGHPVDHRVDVFAYGALSYELLTYRRPFSGQTVRERLKSVLDTNPDPLSKFWAECPALLEQTVERCLMKDPAARFQSFEEVITALERVHREMVDAEEAPTSTFLVPSMLDPSPPLDPRPAAAPSDGYDETALVPQEPAAAPSTEAIVRAPPAEAPAEATLEHTVRVAEIPAQPRVQEVAAPAAPPLPAAVPAASTPSPGVSREAAPVAPSALPAAPPPAAPPVASTPTSDGSRWARSLAAATATMPRTGWIVLGVSSAALVAALAIAGWTSTPRDRAAPPDDSAPAPQRASEPASPAAPAAELGRLVVSAFPWGELLAVTRADGEAVDATPAGTATPLVLSLPPGEYEIQLGRAGEESPPASCRVEVAAGSTTSCRVELLEVRPLGYFKEAGWWR